MIKRRLRYKNKNGKYIYTHQLFIWENEDLKLKLEENNLYGNKPQINRIIKNSSNNKIGYYQFKFDNINYYKIYILPKIVSESEPDKLVDLFNKYLLEYRRLKKKYNKKGYFELDKHIDDFDINLMANSVEEMLIEKYIDCINEILYFFKRHKKETLFTEYYSSQAISDRLDLKSNILEINKSNVHQKRDLVKNNSILAHIAKNCLEFFINKRLPLLPSDDLKLQLKATGKTLERMLKQKYESNDTKYSVYNFLNTRTRKHFNINRDTKRLYGNLLLLVGNKDENNYKIDDLITICFSPEYMYELIVREYLEESEITSDYKLFTFPNKSYSLKERERCLSKIQSKPDFILKNEKDMYIIDAKWKIVRNFSSINFQDVLKLDRDSKIYFENGLKQTLLLVYPSIFIQDKDYIDKTFNYDYSNSPYFKIKKIEIKLPN